MALAALNAIAGDQLGPGLAPLAIRMAVRADGRDVDLSAQAVADAFPHATRKMAVFVHGLAETEDSWQRRGAESEPYGPRLHAEFGYTPVYIRYSTGRHVSENGHELAGLLAGLTAAWPEQVDEFLLVGHSMGGLVIRSACHYGRQESAAWVDRVRHVFYLGSPHLGAPLARAAGFAGWALSKAAETMPFVTLVNGRVRASRICATATSSLMTGLIATRTAACAITGVTHHCWPGRTTARSAPPSPPIPVTRSAPWPATCSSRPAGPGLGGYDRDHAAARGALRAC